MRKRQWRQTVIGLAAVLAMLGILVVEGLRRQQPDALALAAFALTAVLLGLLVRRMPEATQ